MNHTPIPWQLHHDEYCAEEIWGNLEGPLEDGKIHGTHICDLDTTVPGWEANARFIVKAVNCHEKLVKALQTMVKVFNTNDINAMNAFVSIEQAWEVLKEVER